MAVAQKPRGRGGIDIRLGREPQSNRKELAFRRSGHDFKNNNNTKTSPAAVAQWLSIDMHQESPVRFPIRA